MSTSYIAASHKKSYTSNIPFSTQPEQETPEFKLPPHILEHMTNVQLSAIHRQGSFYSYPAEANGKFTLFTFSSGLHVTNI